MGEIIATFADGRLLVYEERLCGNTPPISGGLYIGSGIPVRIGGLRTVERVISIDNNWNNVGVLTPLREVTPGDGKIFVVMRRGDVGVGVNSVLTSGHAITVGISGYACATSAVGNLFSGLGYYAEAISGRTVSGIMIYATVIGY